jgi:hypothetical protein
MTVNEQTKAITRCLRELPRRRKEDDKVRQASLDRVSLKVDKLRCKCAEFGPLVPFPEYLRIATQLLKSLKIEKPLAEDRLWELKSLSGKLALLSDERTIQDWQILLLS